MLYVLPATPTVTLVGPDDTAWWAALGADPAGRSALVIGDSADPAAALVIAAALPDLGAYLPLFHAAVRRTVDAGSGRHVTVPRPLAAPDGAAEPAAASAATLVTLPHTGIRVPDATLQVTGYQELPTPAGVAYTATLRWGPTRVGTIHNEGSGGATIFWPAARSAVDRRELAEFVAASRNADGQPLTEEALLEELITEYEHAAHVAAAARTADSPVRLRAPLGVNGGLDRVSYTAARRTAAKVTTPAQRAALTAQLQRLAVPDGAWWQLWTGQAWEDLTTRSQPDPDRQEPQ
ncbi:hypothetical protein [Dactylosporangium darangshiense]|uniref:Uncharacterized protein n=1 Tax=Dactylosporangium darangshiense TaxID=579108 RepID=A0ABP8DS62_9ACTN